MRPNELLRKARKDRDWQQKDVASRLGIAAYEVSRWERGVVFPGPYYRKKLCEIFDLSARELGLEKTADASPLLDPLIPSLPVGIDALVGRESELAEIRQQLAQAGDRRLFLALHGAPGVGKTALATQLAHDPAIRERFADGILWAAVGPQPAITGLLSRWGSMLNIASIGRRVEEMRTDADWAEALQMVIGSRRMLLIIDDIWRGEDIQKLNVCGPRCACVVTTRFQEIAIGFAGKNARTIHELDDEQSRGVLKCFVPRVVEKEPEQILELIHAVGGLPLALIIIGKYLQVETYNGQQRRLRASLQRLCDPTWRLRLAQERANSAGADGVASSVYAAIALSDRQLDELARLTLRALSIFPAKPHSFSEEAALAVAATTIDALDALTGASLLEAIDDDWYTMHQTIADYGAAEQSNDNAPAVRRRLVDYFVSYVENHQTDYSNLDGKMNNIALALDIAHKEKMTMALIRGACAWTPFLLVRGLYEVANFHLERALQAAEASGDERWIAQVLLSSGRVTERRGQLQQAATLYEKGLTLARKQNDNTLIIKFLANLGEVMVNRGDLPHAETSVREGLALAERLADRSQRYRLLKTLGEVVDDRGDFQQADSLYRQSLALARESGDHEMVSTLLQNLGTKAYKEGQYSQAESWLREGLALARQIGHQQRQSALLANLGMVAIDAENYDQAEQYCQEALTIARNIHHAIRIVNALQNLGILEGRRGNFQQGEQYLRESIALAREIEHSWLISEDVCQLGELYWLQRDLSRARDAFDEALTVAREKELHELQGHALFGLARVAQAQGNKRNARQLGEKSLEIFEKEGHFRASEVKNWLDELHSD